MLKKIQQIYRNAIACISFYYFYLISHISYAYFEGIETSSTDPSTQVEAAVLSLADVVSTIGVAILAWGIGDLVLAMKDDNAGEKQRGMMKVFSGVILIALETLLTAFDLWI